MNSQTNAEASHAAEATRKRTAARKLIERYYFQLTDGCGNQSCSNENCASCQKAPKLEPDEAAARAIQLFKSKAKLCVPPCPPLGSLSRSIPNGANHFELPSTLAQADVRLCRKTKRNGSSKMVTDTEESENEDSNLSKKSAESQTSSVSNSQSLNNVSSPISSSPMEVAKESAHQSIISLDEDGLLEIIEKCQSEQNFSLLIRTLGQVFSSEESLKQSFKRDITKDNLSKEDIRAMEVDEDKDKDSSADGACTDDTKPGVVTVDITSVRRAFSALFKIPDYPFQRALINALIILSENLEFDFKYGQKQNIDPALLNIFVIVMEIPMMQCPEYLEAALPAFCKAASHLPVRSQAVLARTWSTYEPDRLREMLNILHQFISLKVIQGGFTRDYCINDEDTIIAATKLMKIIYYASLVGGEVEDTEQTDEDNEVVEADENLRDLLGASAGSEPKENPRLKQDPLSVELNIKAIDCRKPLLNFDEFYNEPLSEQLEMDRDFAYYKTDSGSPGKFSFMNYSFILTPAVKSMGLYYDNRIRMYSERRMSVLQSIVHGAPPNPYLKLRVRRDHMIADALVGLEMVAMESPTNFKKQLVVEFDGEQGIDEGGVSKEFFQLVVEAIFNPDFAMFTLNPETQTYWFNPTSFENDAQFTLIGIILGLAIYNNVILDVHFPMVVYRKLMGKKGTFYDLKDWNPSLWKGLNDLLSYTGDDMEGVFMQSFRIHYTDVFGTVLVNDLKENGEMLVNQDNKEEFVRLYSDFLLNKSIAKQFQAFKKGFQMVTEDSPLRILFRPKEIELLVCGNKNFDFNALERATEYDGGYLSDSDTIKWFWELVHDFTIEQKRKLLQFTTGSDRVPVGGLSKLKLVIARNGGDTDRLPTAHTCFNVLLLPEYESKEKLEDRLLKAINYSKGFGML